MVKKEYFPTIVGTTRFRSADNEGEFFDLECASNIRNTFATNENTSQVNCGKGGTTTLEKPTYVLDLVVMATKNPDLFGKLYDLVVKNVAGGSITLPERKFRPDENGKIGLLERSNDGKGITDIIVKSEDGQTTYDKDSDYTNLVKDNTTTINILTTGKIVKGEAVLISGKVNQNAAKETELQQIQRVKKKFSVESFGEVTETNEATGDVITKYTTMYASPVILDSQYLLEMKDVFKDGDLAGAELSFPLDDGGKVKYRDEII